MTVYDGTTRRAVATALRGPFGRARSVEKFRKGIMRTMEADGIVELVHIAYLIGHASAGF